MRHLGGIVIGFFGVVVGLVVIAAALGLTRRAAEELSQVPLLLGTVLLLVGGAAIGAVAIFRRMSVAAPLIGAGVALLLTIAGVLVPAWHYALGLGSALGGGLDVLLSLQLPALLAGALLMTSVGVAAPRIVAPSARPADGPTTVLPVGPAHARSAAPPPLTSPNAQPPWGVPGSPR